MKILAPDSCPSCGSKLDKVNAQLFCSNKVDCPAQSSKKLQKFCKQLKLKGFGESALDKLNFTSFNDIIQLTAKHGIASGFSEHMALKLVDIVEDRLALGITPNDFLAACSIPLIGVGAMRKLRFDCIANITYNICQLHGLGDKAASNLVNWIDTEWGTYSLHWEKYFVDSKEETSVSLPTVCITGKLTDFSNRTTAADHLTKLGFDVKSSVTKNVKYLICEDGSNSSSRKKAIDYGITVTTINNLEEKYVK